MRKYVHEVLVNSLVRWNDRPAMTKANDWDVKQQKQTNKQNPGHLYFLLWILTKQKYMSIMLDL